MGARTTFSFLFGAATLLPLQSEAVLVIVGSDAVSSVLLVAVASLGNILGSCVNWWLGLKVEQYKNKNGFPSQSKRCCRRRHLSKIWFWSLLLSWVPIIGDPITLIAGLLKKNFVRFVVMVSIAKIGTLSFCVLDV